MTSEDHPNYCTIENKISIKIKEILIVLILKKAVIKIKIGKWYGSIGGAHGGMVIVVGNGHGDTSSNHGPG